MNSYILYENNFGCGHRCAEWQQPRQFLMEQNKLIQHKVPPSLFLCVILWSCSEGLGHCAMEQFAPSKPAGAVTSLQRWCRERERYGSKDLGRGTVGTCLLCLVDNWALQEYSDKFCKIHIEVKHGVLKLSQVNHEHGMQMIGLCHPVCGRAFMFQRVVATNLWLIRPKDSCFQAAILLEAQFAVQQEFYLQLPNT